MMHVHSFVAQLVLCHCYFFRIFFRYSTVSVHHEGL
jgi:hypothetical protein